MVSKESAKLGLALHRETCLPIDADHSMICKFDSDDKAFEPVLDNMKDLIAYSVAAHRRVDEIPAMPSVNSETSTNQINKSVETTSNTITSDCLRNLAPVDQRKRLWKALRTPAELSPYQWFFETKEYVEWTESERNNVLWILAGPGCGKTTLVANIVDRVNYYPGNTQTLGSTEPLTLFYLFDNNQQIESTAISCIRTVIHQLVEQVPGLLPLLVETYSSLSEKPTSTFTWTWDILWTIFLNMFEELSKLGRRSVRLIVDAIDQCNEKSQTVLLEGLQYLLDTSGHRLFCTTNISILISSRTNFRRKLSPAMLFEMSSDYTANDMEAFIRSEVGKFVQAKELLPLVRDKIVHFLEQKANGMFLWVKLVLEDLHRRDVALTDHVIEETLQAVPLRIGSIYAEIMRDVRKIDRDDVRGIFRWLIFARRSMTIDELETALCIEYDLPHWYDLAGDLQFICGPLIRIDNEEVEFVHETARDYLSTEFKKWRPATSTEEQNPHDKLTQICLRFIAREELSRLSYALPFLTYSITALGYHLAALSKPSSQLLQLVLEFFENQPRVDLTVSWYWRLVNDSPGVSPRGAKRLHIAGYFNILWLIDLAIEKGDAIDAVSQMNDSPLIWASEMGNLKTVRKLLAAGANPNQREWDNWTALHWAATNGHYEVAITLMEANADREWKDANGSSPVDWADRMGHPALASEIEDFAVRMPVVTPKTEIYPTEIDTTIIPNSSEGRRIYALSRFGDDIEYNSESSSA